MCSNYVPVTRSSRLLEFFGVSRSKDEPPLDTFPTGMAPFIKLKDGTNDKLEAPDGHFGLLPGFQTELAAGRKTYNARSETVASKPSFRESWRKGWRCVVPVELIYEPCWETGKAVRWAIFKPGQQPMGIAGIYRLWTAPDGTQAYSFAMLTVNADGHPIFKRMHRPEDERRMVVILDRAQFLPWLSCSTDAASEFFRQYHGPLLAEPRPAKKRGDAGKGDVPPPVAPDAQEGLF